MRVYGMKIGVMKKRPTQTLCAILSFPFILMMAAGHLSAQVPSLLEYDGFMSGNITGNRTIGVKLYNASTNGTILYSENVGTVKVTQGQFYFQYGQNGTAGNSTSSIAATLTGTQQWLALTVNGTEQTPRERLVAVPFALKSADAQKTDADLRNVIQAFGQVITTFGGNSTNLLSNPVGTVSTIQKAVADLLEVRKRAEVVAVTANITAESNRSYVVPENSPAIVSLPTNPKIGDSIRVLGDGVRVSAPSGSMIINGWTPLTISLSGIGEVSPEYVCSDLNLFIGSENLDVIYSFVKQSSNPSNSYLGRSIDAGKTWSSLGTFDSTSTWLLSCSADGSRFLYEAMSTNGTILRLGTAFGNQTKTLAFPTGARYADRALIAKTGNRIFAFAGDDIANSKLMVTENDGASWRTANLTVGNMTYSVGDTMMRNPIAISENGSLIALKTNNQSNYNELIISENAGISWRKANLPVSEIRFSQILLSGDGKIILLFFKNNNSSNPSIEILVSRDFGVSWNREKCGLISGTESQKFNYTSSLSKIFTEGFSSPSSNIVSTDFGKNWATWRQTILTDTPLEAYLCVNNLSSDGNRKICSPRNMSGLVYKSFSKSMMTSGFAELVFVGAGNWIVNNIGSN